MKKLFLMMPFVFAAIAITSCDDAASNEVCYRCSNAYVYENDSISATTDFCYDPQDSTEAQEADGRVWSCLNAGGTWSIQQ